MHNIDNDPFIDTEFEHWHITSDRQLVEPRSNDNQGRAATELKLPDAVTNIAAIPIGVGLLVWIAKVAVVLVLKQIS